MPETNLTWWEWEELEAAIQERPDLWAPIPDRPNTYFRVADEQPLYALTAYPSPSKGEFRLVQIRIQPLNWSQDEASQHLLFMREKFTSFPFRAVVESFLKEDLHQDPTTAYKAAIIIARFQQGPLAKASVEEVNSGPSLPILSKFKVTGGDDTNLYGTIEFRQQGDMLRSKMLLWRRMPTGYAPITLDGFLRVQGITRNAVELLTGTYIQPLSYEEKQAILFGNLTGDRSE